MDLKGMGWKEEDGSGQGQVTDTCKGGNKSSDSIKCEEFIG